MQLAQRSTLKVGLLLFTIAVSVGLSVGMWVTGKVPFNVRTFTLHIVSIYIGVALVLLFQRRRGERDEE